MIVSKAPLRVSFVGGGSDLPEFSDHHEGAVVSCTIDSHIYVTFNPSFWDKTRLAWRNGIETVEDTSKLQHTLVREILAEYPLDNYEINIISDMPGRGTGLGSSSALTVAMLNGIDRINQCDYKKPVPERAFTIERKLQNLGRQDQYASALGGAHILNFYKEGVSAGIIPPSIVESFWEWLSFLWIGESYETSRILFEQTQNLNIPVTADMARAATRFYHYLLESNFPACAREIRRNWNLKKKLNKRISNDRIDSIISHARFLGSMGAKVLGSGGNGVILIVSEPYLKDEIVSVICRDIGEKYGPIRPLNLRPIFQGAIVTKI